MNSGARITVEGLNYAKTLKALSEIAGTIRHTKRIDSKRFEFVVNSSDIAKVVAYLDEKCYNILNIEYLGITKILRMLRNPIHIATILLTIITLYIGSKYCLRIEVTSTCSEQDVRQTLAESGVDIGCNLHGVELDYLENLLVTSFDNLAYAIVDIIGSTVYVELIDRVLPNDIVDYDSPYDLVATHDGIVDNIVCISGTPLVEVGDKVTKGQILIAGYRTYPDSSTEPIRANGQVTAVVSQTGEAYYQPVITAYRTTGEVTRTCGFDIFGYHVEGKEVDYRFFDTQITKTSLFPLNLIVYSYIHTEKAPYIIEETFDEQLATLIDRAMNDACNKADFTILMNNYTTTEDKVIVTVYGRMIITSQLGG